MLERDTEAWRTGYVAKALQCTIQNGRRSDPDEGKRGHPRLCLHRLVAVSATSAASQLWWGQDRQQPSTLKPGLGLFRMQDLFTLPR